MTLAHLTPLFLHRSLKNTKCFVCLKLSFLPTLCKPQSKYFLHQFSSTGDNNMNYLVKLATIKRTEFYSRGKCSATHAGCTDIINRPGHLLCKEKKDLSEKRLCTYLFIHSSFLLTCLMILETLAMFPYTKMRGMYECNA